MDRILRLAASTALLGLLLSGCATQVGTSCLCAAGTAYDGTFYHEYANTSVRAQAPIGRSEKANDCCDEGERRVTVYSIEGIDPDIAIATRGAGGEVIFNVASDLPKQKQAIADQFAKKHHHPSDSN